MSEHLSALELDEVAAGLAPEPVHVATCAACTTRLADLKSANAAFMNRPEAKRHVATLTNSAPAQSRRGVVVALALAAAAALAVVAWPRTDDGVRVKGAPTVSLFNEAGAVVTSAKVGDRLTLAVGAPGFRKVTVFATDADGKRTQLWSGPIEPKARVDLMQLEVTPGSVSLTAEFEDGSAHATATTRLEVP